MYLQTDNTFNKMNNNCAKYGCYFFSILYYVENFTGRKMTKDRISSTFIVLKNLGYIDDEYYIKDPEKIFNYFNILVDYTGRHEQPDFEAKKDNFEISQFCYTSSSGVAYCHFVPTKSGTVLFDSLGSSNCVKYGEVRSKRVFILR